MGAYEFNTERPLIAVYPSSLWCSYLGGGPEPEPQTLLVRNCGGTGLVWKIAYDCNWLDAVPQKGRSAGEIDHVTLTVNPDSMPAGYYRCTLTALGRNAAASPATAQVTLTVGPVLPVPDDFATIQDAIDAAADGDIVVIADGVYTGEGDHDIDFLGKAITVRSENGPENCIIDCRSTSRYGYDYHYGFAFYNQENHESVLDGLTITNAVGAIYCLDDSNPIIQNCNITGNIYYGAQGGGGITCHDSSPTITNCTITDNLAEGWPGGGGICSIDSSPKITNCVITANAAENYRAGGIYCSNQADQNTGPIITNCTITDNYAYECGGIYAESSSPIISNCIINNNKREHIGAGGITCAYGSSPTITKCRLTGNYGGAIESWDSSAIIADCKITANFGGFRGSAIRSQRSGIIIANCELSGNWGRGEVVNCYYKSHLTIKNCTIADNKAGKPYDLRDSGIYCSDDSTLILNNSVLWGGTFENNGSDPNTITVTYSNVEGGWPGEGNIDVDPCFVRTGHGYWDDNNTPDWPFDDAWVSIDGDYHLLENSPCIDTGDPNYIPEPNETDLDGNPRIVNERIDMGAYEYTPPIPAELDINPKTLNLKSKGNFITCRIQLPEDYNVAVIDPNTVMLEEQIQADWVRLDGQAAIVKFSRSALQQILADLQTPAEAELLVTGQLTDGTIFEGTDTITVINKGRKE